LWWKRLYYKEIRGHTTSYENGNAQRHGKKPVIIEAYVDPFEPMVPPKAKSEFIQKISESFAKGQPYSERIGLTLYRSKFETM
jgi:hypothetical protein